MTARTSKFMSHGLRPPVLVSFLVALCLLFAGVRVPELSRPQRPKQSPRAVVENQLKSSSDNLKVCGDLLAFLPRATGAVAPCGFLAAHPAVSLRYDSPLLVSNPGRSPPFSLS